MKLFNKIILSVIATCSLASQTNAMQSTKQNKLSASRQQGTRLRLHNFKDADLRDARLQDTEARSVHLPSSLGNWIINSNNSAPSIAIRHGNDNIIRDLIKRVFNPIR